jgi:hypothetical protein
VAAAGAHLGIAPRRDPDACRGRLNFSVVWIARAQELALAGELAVLASEHAAREIEVRWLPTHVDTLVPAREFEFAELEALFSLHRAGLTAKRVFGLDAVRPKGSIRDSAAPSSRCSGAG